MESVKAAVRIYTVHTKVVSVREHKQKQWIAGSGSEALFKDISIGWYVTFDGSRESLFFGMDKPNFAVGDKVKISFERTT